MRFSLRALAFVYFLGCWAVPVSATTYSFSNIPYPHPKADPGQQTGAILNDGTVFGSDVTVTGPGSYCCVPYAYHNGHFTNYPSLPDGAPLETITGNNVGTLTGTYEDTIPLPGGGGVYVVQRGFIDQNGSYTKIPLLSTYTYFAPAAINDGGSILGLIINAQRGFPTAAIYQDGRYTRLSYKGLDLFVSGINDAGEVVGSTYDGRAFSYKNGSFTFFSVKGAEFTAFDGVNNLGQIVGYSQKPDQFGSSQDFVLQPDGTLSNIALPSGASSFYPTGINDLGQIAGTYLTDCDPN